MSAIHPGRLSWLDVKPGDLFLPTSVSLCVRHWKLLSTQATSVSPESSPTICTAIARLKNNATLWRRISQKLLVQSRPYFDMILVSILTLQKHNRFAQGCQVWLYEPKCTEIWSEKSQICPKSGHTAPLSDDVTRRFHTGRDIRFGI